MKLKVTFKSPDALDCALTDALYNGATMEDLDAVTQLTSRFLQYGEYVTIEFDAESGTATVLPK